MTNVSEQLNELNQIIFALEHNLSSRAHIIHHPSMKERNDLHTAFKFKYETDVNFRARYNYQNDYDFISIGKNGDYK